MIYHDKSAPRLSPAYDILMTSVYIENERHFALNLAKNKDWYLAEMKHFEEWAEKSVFHGVLLKTTSRDHGQSTVSMASAITRLTYDFCS